MASYMMNDRDEARRAFHQAMAASKDLAGREEVQRRLGLLDLAEGKSTSLSNAELQMMLRQQPDDLVTRMLLGESYEKQGAFAEAAATYEEATKLNPKLLSAAIKLAELNAGPLNDSAKALEFARKAREIAPNDPKVLGMLGDAAYQTGNFKWAYSLLQESARRLPNNTEVLYDFAWAAYSMGRVSEARQAMQRLLALSPNSNQQSDASLFLRMTALDHEGASWLPLKPRSRTPSRQIQTTCPRSWRKLGGFVKAVNQVLPRPSILKSSAASLTSPLRKSSSHRYIWRPPKSAPRPTTWP